jgi:hypothetical protein
MARLKTPMRQHFVIRRDDCGGTAIVPVFDWERAGLSGSAYLNGFPTYRLLTGLLPYFDNPGALVRIVHETR